MICDVAYDLLIEEQERLALARYTGQTVAHSLGGTVVPTYESAADLVDEWLATDLRVMTEAQSDDEAAKADFVDVMFGGGGR